jgi:RND family efflux transporter MFP subunit
MAETGTIEMDRTIEVKSQVAGRIMRLLADEGDAVTDGQLLAVIEPDPNKALQLAGKRASVARADMELAEQRRQLEQKRQNHLLGIIPKEEIERAEYLFAMAESSLAQNRLELQILEREVRAQARAIQTTEDSLLLQDYEIVSPMDGIVTTRPVEEGELVTSAVSSNQSSTLFEVGDPDHLIVRIQIPEIDIGEAQPGLSAEITVDALPGERFAGRLRHVAPTGGSGQGSSIVTFDAEISVTESDKRLRAGMTADVDIIIGRLEDVPFLPVEAVATIYRKDEEGNETEEIDRRIVYAESDSGWTERSVRTGLESNTRIEILEGLAVGDSVHPDAQARLEQLADNENPGAAALNRRRDGRRQAL